LSEPGGVRGRTDQGGDDVAGLAGVFDDMGAEETGRSRDEDAAGTVWG
jgi:hypothetical protein